MNYEDMHFTDNDKEKLKENKRMIIEWITENIIPNMDEDSQIKCDFGDTYRCRVRLQRPDSIWRGEEVDR